MALGRLFEVHLSHCRRVSSSNALHPVALGDYEGRFRDCSAPAGCGVIPHAGHTLHVRRYKWPRRHDDAAAMLMGVTQSAFGGTLVHPRAKQSLADESQNLDTLLSRLWRR